MELTNREKQEIFTEIKRAVNSKNWPEYMRKLGLSDSVLEQYEGHNDGKHEMLSCWTMECGRFTRQNANFLELVKQEVLQQTPRQREVDRGLTTELGKNRDRAFLLYDVVHRYFDDSQWNQIARQKLEIHDHIIHDIGADNQRSNVEKRYQTLAYWVAGKPYRHLTDGYTHTETNFEIATELKRLNVDVPDEYIVPDGPVQ